MLIVDKEGIFLHFASQERRITRLPLVLRLLSNSLCYREVVAKTDAKAQLQAVWTMEIPIQWNNGKETTFQMLVAPDLSWPILFGENHPCRRNMSTHRGSIPRPFTRTFKTKSWTELCFCLPHLGYVASLL